MASEEDMLFGHLDRLPPLQPNQFIRRLAYDWPAKYASIKTFISGMEQAAGFSLPDPGFVGTSPGLQFFDTEHGQVLIRAFGPSDKPCLILLHDAPGSGRSLLPLAEKLAQLYYIIVPDLPGNGDSQPPVEPISMAVAGADAIARIVDKLQLQSFTLAAMGCSAIVAAEYLRRGDPRLAMTYVTDLPAFDLVGAEALQSELTPTSEGGHWLRAWQIVRDNQIYQPWFNGTIAAQRKTQGNFDADWLHEETFELMKSARTYHLLAKEALSTDLRQLFATWTDRVRILAPGETLEIIIGADRADQL
jgi:pimeloyl-ACP methyl ester carboxylesterase